MEKQGKTKSVDQNITEPKTLSCGIGEIEWQAEDWLPGVRVIHVHGMGGLGKTTLIKILCTARKVEETAAMTPSVKFTILFFCLLLLVNNTYS
jgi:translation initiation factor RLI1